MTFRVQFSFLSALAMLFPYGLSFWFVFRLAIFLLRTKKRGCIISMQPPFAIVCLVAAERRFGDSVMSLFQPASDLEGVKVGTEGTGADNILNAKADGVLFLVKHGSVTCFVNGNQVGSDITVL